MIKEWSYLPNATHVDWVLETLENDSEMWAATWDATWRAAEDDAWKAMREAAWAARVAAWVAARVATEEASMAARVAAWKASWNAIAALIVWDDSSKFLDMSVEEVTELANEGNHAAVLLLPAVVVKNKLKKNTKLNKPRLFLDEGAWCALLGNNLQDGICGYGDSPAEAMQDYEKNKLKESA